MVVKSKIENLRLALIVQIASTLVLLFWFLALTTKAQTVGEDAQSADVQTKTEVAKTPVLTPVLKNYREVTIGMPAGEVKDKLGKAKIADKDGFYYELSGDETVQVMLDAENKVRVISVVYKVKNGNAPKIEDVLGTAAGIEPAADGSVYKLVRYPEAGFWVAYNRTAGDNAIVTVTIQKL